MESAENKLKNQNSETNLQDFIPNSNQDVVGRSDLSNQTEPGKEKKIEQLAQEFCQQTTPPIPIPEHLQVINEEDLAAILPDVATSANGSFDEFVSLSTRNNDSTSTLIESLDGPYDDVTLLSEHGQISKSAVEAESSPDNPQNVLAANGADDYSTSSTSRDVEQISSLPIENPDLINSSVHDWLLKPSDDDHVSKFDKNHSESISQNSAKSVSPSRKSLRSGNKRRQSQMMESNFSSCDGEPSIKIDCSVSHISLDSGFGGSPSYTSSPNSAYLYSPMSVETKSPTSTFRSAGARTFYEANFFKRSQSPPERNFEKVDDTFQDHLQSNDIVTRRRPGRPPNKGSGRGIKKSSLKKSDICSLVEKFISIEERSKKTVKKSPHRERIKKVRRWLKLERKKKSKKGFVVESNTSTDLDKLIQRFQSFTIVEKNPHLTRASNKIVKSKFRCKCCADNYPKKVFSHSKTNNRKKEKASESPKENASPDKINSRSTTEHQSTVNKKKVKRNFEHRSEKYEQRLPLKKRLYRIPITPHTKTDPSRTLADFVEENKYKASSSSSKKSERNELNPEDKMIQLHCEDNDASSSVPVTPKKRFQMKHLSTSESKKLASILSKNVQCNISSASQTEMNSGAVEQCAGVKTSNFSDEICKKMKCVSLMSSNDLNIRRNLMSKDLSNVSKTPRNITLKVSTRLSKRALESQSEVSQKLNTDLDENTIMAENIEDGFIGFEDENQGTSSTKFYSDRSINDTSSQSVIVCTTKQITCDAGSSMSFESKDCVKDRKKRRRTFNRTGFPTKKKKKKHIVMTANNPTESPTMKTNSVEGENGPTLNSDELICSQELGINQGKLICSEGISKLDLSGAVTGRNPESVTRLSHRSLNSGSTQAENVALESSVFDRKINSDKTNTEITHARVSEPVVSDTGDTLSQNRKATLRTRIRRRNEQFHRIESKEKGCDNISKIKKMYRDHQAFMDRGKYIISQKQYLTAGLFSKQFKVDNSENFSVGCDEQFNPENNVQQLLPSPSYYTKWVRQQKIDFTLPFDIWFSHKKSTPCFTTETIFSKTQRASVSAGKNGHCDHNFGSNSEKSATDSSSDSAKTTPDCDIDFSLLSLDTCTASDCDTEISFCDIELLTDKQASYIRENSCFLVRNLIKAKKVSAVKHCCNVPSTWHTVSESSPESQFDGKMEEKLLRSTESFQNPSFNSVEIRNIQSDNLFDSTKNKTILVNPPEINSISGSNFETKICSGCSSEFESSHSLLCRSCYVNHNSGDMLSPDSDINKSLHLQNFHLCTAEIPVETNPSHAESGQKFFKMLVAGNCKIQTGENVYVLKDNPETETEEVPSFGRRDCDVFHIKRLWRDKNNDGYAYGHYYLRPHETFHEPSRKFFQNELMKSPLCETVPISRIVDHCHVLDLNSYCKGRPVAASMEHVFVCEYRTDKAAKTFSRIPKRKARFSADVALDLYQSPIRPVRDFKPYCPTSNFKSRRKQYKISNPLKTEVKEVSSTCSPTQNASLIPFATKISSEQTSQCRRLNSIICKLSEKASSV